MDVLTSGIDLPVASAATSRFGVDVPLCLLDATDGALLSFIDCSEFCLPRPVGLLLLVGGGDGREGLISGNVLRIGEDASEGDIADVTVPFLFRC
jgi:hypothetical protein